MCVNCSYVLLCQGRLSAWLLTTEVGTLVHAKPLLLPLLIPPLSQGSGTGKVPQLQECWGGEKHQSIGRKAINKAEIEVKCLKHYIGPLSRKKFKQEIIGWESKSSGSCLTFLGPPVLHLCHIPSQFCWRVLCCGWKGIAKPVLPLISFFW